MTRAEAIEKLEILRQKVDEDTYRALIMGIKALEQEPCDRLEYGIDGNVYKMTISNGKEFEQEPCDAISREAVINEIQHAEINFTITSKVDFSEYKKEIQEIIDHIVEAQINAVNELPSVQPSRKGHWIEEDMFDGDVAYRCSACNELFCIIEGTPKDNEYNFCPNCGAEMRGDTDADSN